MAQSLEPFTPKNEATYDSLISLIENNQERLALILVACDDLRLRQRIITRYELEARQAKIRPFRIVLGTEPSLRAGLAKLELREGYPAVVTVTGAEWLLRVTMREDEEQSDLDKFFGYLQWTREGLREFRYPIVLWVTHRILREISKRSPDFWSWRKAVLRFASEEEEAIVLRQGEPRSLSIQSQPNEEFLPPLEELLSEIQQLESTSPESANLATLYDQLGQVYAERIAKGEAANLEQERERAIAAFQTSIDRYQQLNNQSELVDVLRGFGNFLYDQSQFRAAISVHQKSLEIARDIGDRHGEAASLNNLGNAYDSLGQHQRAIELHQQSLEIKREIGNRCGEAASLNNLGNAYRSIGQYQGAIDFYQQSLEIAREIGDRDSEANSLASLGNVYNSLKQHQRAIDFYQQSLEIACEIGGRKVETTSLIGLGNIYRSLGQYQRAIDLYQQSLEIACEIGNCHNEAASLAGLGNAYDSLGQYQQAIDFHQQSLEIAREVGDRQGEACSLHSLGNSYFSLDKYQQALNLYQQSLDIFREVGHRHYEANALFTKANSLAKYESRRFEALSTLQQARDIYAELDLDREVERCDEAIYNFNTVIATEQRQLAPSILVAPTIDSTSPKSRRSFDRKIKWTFWFCVGIAIVLLIVWIWR